MPNCPEGAIQIIDQKARLISDLFCDGLGACIGFCPQGAITIEERQAEEYDEKKVMANIVKQGKNVIKAHLEHLKSHQQDKFLHQALAYLKEQKIEIPQHGSCGCPGAQVMDFRKKEPKQEVMKDAVIEQSELRQWPIQIMLVPVSAPYLNQADLLIAADCVPFAYANFHHDLLKDKILLVGCPKLDDLEIYQEKFSQILKCNQIHSIVYAHMEVPCCFGLVEIIKKAISQSGKDVPFKEAIISIQGERLG